MPIKGLVPINILGNKMKVKKKVNNTEKERKIIEAMALGLRDGDDGKHLITFHPRGPGLSSDYLHNAEWLDFNMFQSSHGGHDHDGGPNWAEHYLYW